MHRYADKPAFRCFGQTLTYADTDRLSRDFAAYLQCGLGVGKGERIAVMLPNLPAFPLALMGIVRAGAIQVNVNPLYTPRELEHQLNDAAEVIVIFSASATPSRDHRQDRDQARYQRVGDGTRRAASRCGPAPARVVAFADALTQGRNFPHAGNWGGDLLFLQYTGGTTGLRGAALSHRNLVANTRAVQSVHAIRRPDRASRGHGAAALSHLR